jgi:hypothetical protein
MKLCIADKNRIAIDGLRHERASLFPEYQLPAFEGLQVIGAHAVSPDTAPNSADDIIRRQNMDGMGELKVTANPPPIALQQSWLLR